jgi:hypothetical protein
MSESEQPRLCSLHGGGHVTPMLCSAERGPRQNQNPAAAVNASASSQAVAATSARSWSSCAGATLDQLQMQVLEYIPGCCSLAGTGTGLCFAL